MTALDRFLISPIGPSLLLVVGALLTALLGRWVRRPAVLTGLALLFVGCGWLVAADFAFPDYGCPHL
ncbi:MAG: hypothetical protein R2867_45930 [Caldilineaceae bacterium]